MTGEALRLVVALFTGYPVTRSVQVTGDARWEIAGTAQLGGSAEVYIIRIISLSISAFPHMNTLSCKMFATNGNTIHQTVDYVVRIQGR